MPSRLIDFTARVRWTTLLGTVASPRRLALSADFHVPGPGSDLIWSTKRRLPLEYSSGGFNPLSISKGFLASLEADSYSATLYFRLICEFCPHTDNFLRMLQRADQRNEIAKLTITRENQALFAHACRSRRWWSRGMTWSRWHWWRS